MTNEQKAEKALKGFLKELGKKGFTKSIKKHLSLIWQESEVFDKALKNLENIKYKVSKTFKFISYNSQQKQYRFEVEINDETTNFFVQPLKEPGVPFDGGHYGVNPVKLNKFSKELEDAIKEVGKDIAKIKPQTQAEKDHQEIYLQFLEDGGEPEDFADWLIDMEKSGKKASNAGKELKDNNIEFDKKE